MQGLNGADINTIRIPAAVQPGILSSRPTIDGDELYYVRWRAANNPVTMIERKPAADVTQPGTVCSFCTDMAANYAEPCGLGGDMLVVSSTVAGHGGYDLFLVDFTQEPVVSLDGWLAQINTAKQELGASFWRRP